jgi:hypothetical protein
LIDVAFHNGAPLESATPTAISLVREVHAPQSEPVCVRIVSASGLLPLDGVPSDLCVLVSLCGTRAKPIVARTEVRRKTLFAVWNAVFAFEADAETNFVRIAVVKPGHSRPLGHVCLPLSPLYAARRVSACLVRVCVCMLSQFACSIFKTARLLRWIFGGRCWIRMRWDLCCCR